DITHCWDCEENHGSWSSWGIMRILDKQKGLRIHAAPGHWNDPDMMEVGNGMSFGEDRAHFSLWAMLAAPLIAGNDARTMSKETREILTNKEVIAVDQDALGIQGFSAITEDGLEVWVKPLANDEWAVCFLNRSNEAKTVNFDWKENFIKDDSFQKQLDAKKTTYKVRDLWAKKDLGMTDAALKTAIPAHDVVMLRLTK
ncbi:MAG: glycoside hydrolase family 27 protein, partial [Actinomycetota bacterium]